MDQLKRHRALIRLKAAMGARLTPAEGRIMAAMLRDDLSRLLTWGKLKNLASKMRKF